MQFIPLTRANFEEHKKRAIKILDDLTIDDLDSDFVMTVKQGIITGNHANECDSCNLLHYLMAYAMNLHRLRVGK